MKVLLSVLGVGRQGFWGFIERFQLRPAMGLLMLTAVGREAGHQVDLTDQRVEHFSTEQWIERAVTGRYDVVGLSTYSVTRDVHAACLRQLRNHFPGKIVVGGPAAIPECADFWLESGADAMVIGEGERTFVELLSRWEANKPWLDVAGTAAADANGRTSFGPPRSYLTVAELERLPYPAWTPFWIRSYVDRMIIDARFPTAGIIAARGCPFRCAFCGSPRMWRGVRQRSVDNVIAEIDWLVKEFGVRHLGFSDDIFGVRASWVHEFCDAMQRRSTRPSWMICMHPLMFGRDRRAVFAAMVRAGLNFVSFGAQSADDTVLRNINRTPAELEGLKESIAICRSLGIGSAVTYIFGLPGDTPETAQKAINLVLEMRPTLADFHPLWYFRGSELSDKYPNCDGNPYGYAEHKRWAKQARRRFYFDFSTIARIVWYVGRKNPRYFLTLIRIALAALSHYLFESDDVTIGDSGDERTSPPGQSATEIDTKRSAMNPG
jgi:radical SAM superfamily enzyme YgiQ (UPF0313 family)